MAELTPAEALATIRGLYEKYIALSPPEETEQAFARLAAAVEDAERFQKAIDEAVQLIQQPVEGVTISGILATKAAHVRCRKATREEHEAAWHRLRKAIELLDAARTPAPGERP